jgi:hypothetical protein
VRLGFIAAFMGVAAYLLLVARTVGVIGQHKLTNYELPQDAVTLFTLWWSFSAAAFLPLLMALVAGLGGRQGLDQRRSFGMEPSRGRDLLDQIKRRTV